MTNNSTLRITEIFHSLQGESELSGLPTVFIRLTGCPLRCQYCDTEYAFKGGKLLSIETIVEQINEFQCNYICVTGGEPLAQPNCNLILNLLCNLNYSVSLETSGAMSLKFVDKRVHIVMDIKTPSSKEMDKNLYTNIQYLKKNDEIKFVICNKEDYIWACKILSEHNLLSKCKILFSPSWKELNPTELANWIIADKLNVRFQIQLHKILWNDTPGH